MTHAEHLSMAQEYVHLNDRNKSNHTESHAYVFPRLYTLSRVWYGNGLVEHIIFQDILAIHKGMIDIFGNGTHLRYTVGGIENKIDVHGAAEPTLSRAKE